MTDQEKKLASELLDFDLDAIKEHIPEGDHAIIALFKDTDEGYGLGVGFHGKVDIQMTTQVIAALAERIMDDFSISPNKLFKDVEKILVKKAFGDLLREVVDDIKSKKSDEKNVEGE